MSRVVHRPPPRRGVRLVRDVVVVALVALLASALIRTFLIQSFYIPSASMEHTLLGHAGHHDRILVDRLVPSVIPLQRGDVVVFTDPGGWLETGTSGQVGTDRVRQVLGALMPFGTDGGDHLVKRVIGLPGDRVACCDVDGRMTVNGAAVHEPYAVVPRGFTAVSLVAFDVVVPAGRLWVMGDNRYDSRDSRFERSTPSKGFVPISDVTGRAMVVSWPVSRWSWLTDYPAAFARVPSAAR